MSQSRSSRFRVGVDIGGTFTDIVVLGDDGSVLTRKVSSTTDDYARGIARGMSELIADTVLTAPAIQEIIHGTTVATNAILEHRGALTGLITTDGFRDVLEIRRLRMPEMYNLLYEKPVPLVERYLRREVPERISAQGEIITPLDEERTRAEIARLVREGVESIAVCFLNSYASPVHERRVGELIAEVAPQLSYSLSCDVLPEVREYERTSTTVINAYVRPVVERYLQSLVRHLAEIGVEAPVLIMQSNGGILSVRTAMEKPVHIVESGPAAGVIGARILAKQVGMDNAIAFDMGGTTAKASIIEEGRIHITSEYEVGSKLSSQGLNLAGGGYAMKVPVIDISEVGAGGGSIIAIDRGGSLQVGPRSAGAVPGPVCYGLGGTEATVTDANVVLGYLNPAYLAGGAVPIDAERSREAIAEQVATPLGVGLLEAAWAAHVVANANMIGAIKAVSTQRGRDPREFALVAFGGSGPVHAVGMARLLEMPRIIVPPTPGLFSAFGLLFADHEHHAVQTYYRRFQTLDLAELNAWVGQIEAAALAELATEGYPADRVRLIRSADIRYVGQGFELNVPMPDGELTAETLAHLEAAFNEEHERTYGHRSEGNPVQFVNLRLLALGLRDEEQPLSASWWADGHSELAVPPPRKAYFGEAGLLPTPVLRRSDLANGRREGPFIVEEYDATTVVPPGCAGWLDAVGNIVIEVGEERGSS
ncbi:MAG: hydantoinase/oxoprolinase family protein [Chloroflexi bacterium]|nr:hydantoinase/oxoprolinase family protein [Chloroflexota bacterium]